jgi:hypothetical protein
MKWPHIPNPFDLITGDDGKLVLTKLQAATFHLLMAAAVAFVTWIKQDFVFEMWALYSAVAVGHHFIDKSSAQYAAFKERQLETPSTVTTSTTTTKEIT